MTTNIAVEKVTPKMAADWLNANKINRALRAGIVEKYASDMRAGKWTQCTVAVSFYDDGNIADGQHRLWAIVESGATVPFIVARGLTRPDGLNIDTGLTRRLADNARISGSGENLTHEFVAACRAIEYGARRETNPVASSFAAKLEYIFRHREAAEWACTHGPRGKTIRNSAMLGAIGRAYYAEGPGERLIRFCEVAGGAYSEGRSESAAVTIRNYMIAKGSATLSDIGWLEMFLKIQNAIAYFMRGSSLTILRAVNDEAYPLGRKMTTPSRYIPRGKNKQEAAK
jgi:hypothetical protein